MLPSTGVCLGSQGHMGCGMNDPPNVILLHHKVERCLDNWELTIIPEGANDFKVSACTWSMWSPTLVFSCETKVENQECVTDCVKEDLSGKSLATFLYRCQSFRV